MTTLSVTMDAEALATQCSVCGVSSAEASTYRRSFCPPKTSTPALGPTHRPVQGVKGLFFSGSIAAVAWRWPRPPSADVKNYWSFTSTPPYTVTTCIGTTLSFDGDGVRHFLVPNQLHSFLKVHHEYYDVSHFFAHARNFSIYKLFTITHCVL